jgi:glycosyltransferase involved in cell wall biosynthesis
MIYHHPLLLPQEGRSGSMVRICRMIDAFRNIGYNVHIVAGYARERKEAIEKIKTIAEEGTKFDFLYSESSTNPTLLGKRNIGKPFLEIDFFRWCKRKGIPTGVYYRDIYWRFELFKNITSWQRRAIAIPLYWIDWIHYVTFIDLLFLPSLNMAAFLPHSWRRDWIHALPPGCDIRDKQEKLKMNKAKKGLKLLYVGGVKPPLYDLTPLFESVNNTDDVSLTLCCRKNEWQEVRENYKNIPNDKVNIIHKDSRQLNPYYFAADAFILAREHHPYLLFAMPVKIFEAMGFGLPLISISGTLAADFISGENIGWVVENTSELTRLFGHLVNNPDAVNEKKRNVEKIREQHTWEERAKQAASILVKDSGELDSIRNL